MNNGVPGDIPGSNQPLLPPCWTVGRNGGMRSWGAFRSGTHVRSFRTRAEAVTYVWEQHRAREADPPPPVEDVDESVLRRLRAAREEAQR